MVEVEILSFAKRFKKVSYPEGSTLRQLLQTEGIEESRVTEIVHKDGRLIVCLDAREVSG